MKNVPGTSSETPDGTNRGGRSGASGTNVGNTSTGTNISGGTIKNGPGTSGETTVETSSDHPLGYKLTIKGETKIKRELTKSRDKHKSQTCIIAIKWISTFIIAALLLACVTQSKVSIISLSEHMHTHAQKTSEDPASTAITCRAFVMLFLILLIPHCLNLFRGIRRGLFRKDIPWPSLDSLTLGIVISFAETVGTCTFVMKVSAMTQPYIVILFMNGVFILPICVSLVEALRKSEPQSNSLKKKIIFVTACFLELAGLTFTGILWYKNTPTDLEDILYPITGVFCLSCAWLPQIQSLMLQKRTNSSETQVPDSDKEKATWKMVFYLSLLKILFTVVVSPLLLWYSNVFENAEEFIQCFAMGWHNWDENLIYYFVANVSSSVLGYVVGFIACTTSMQKGSYVLPLCFATPLAAVLFSVKNSCLQILIDKEFSSKCNLSEDDVWCFCLAVAFFVFGHSFSYGYLIISSPSLVKQDEAQLFWFPTYNPALLEQWLLLSKRNEHTDKSQGDQIARAKNPGVIICTTMYREAKHEMKQVLGSIKELALRKGNCRFESHIFFDGAVSDGNLTHYMLQLLNLLSSTLGLEIADFEMRKTPYGMSLLCQRFFGMVFNIHLKDNEKVKNKKRWSQIMYMSYVLDYFKNEQKKNNGNGTGFNEDDYEYFTYILTTDADVRFTPDAVEALLDLMNRDLSVGAVCARTHPIGNGPLVWYQVFEYAIGHWFQKVQAGWRIEYCAASENSTHCPEEFDEFYNQRRRWIVSTLANMMLLMKKWHIMALFNHRVSLFFLLYQALLLFATLIGPSSVILVVSGGLVYGWSIDTTTSMVLQILICVGFTLICLFTSRKTQLIAAKFLTFLYAVVMTAVVVGTAVAVAKNFSEREPVTPAHPNETVSINEINPSFISNDIRISTTTVFLGFMVGIFTTTGLLHLKECVYLAHGIWYLLFLPSGNLILVLYSICNITDKSWGTRVAECTSSNQQKTLRHFLETVCFCCFPRNESDKPDRTRYQRGDQDNQSFDEEQGDNFTDASSNNSVSEETVQPDPQFIDIRARFNLHEATNLEQKESDFWNNLTQECLLPNSSAFRSDEELKQKLEVLRNQWLVIFVASNSLWLILISTLANHGQLLNVFGSNLVGVLVLILFTFVLLIQFLAMLIHRLGTLTHFLGRAPYRPSTDRDMQVSPSTNSSEENGQPTARTEPKAVQQADT